MINQKLKEKLQALKIMPVIQIDDANDAVKLADVLVENGLSAAEITFRTPAAYDAICAMRKAYPEMILCAGTVLTKEQVDLAYDAGVDFVVSPGFNPTTVNYCIDKNIPIIPGINNPSLVEQAMEMGLTMLKFFPAEASGGIAMLKSLTGPYGQIELMPTGGVNTNNLLEYLAIPQVVACGGTWIAPANAINAHHWDLIATNVKEVVKLLNK